MRRALLFAAAVFAAVALLPASSASSAGENRAVVVVELPTGETRSACVVFKEASITGLDLLRTARMDPETYGMGEGAAVCKLCGQGCPKTRSGCLSCDGGKYWQYYRSNGGGEFQYSNVGAGTSAVTDGDVDGWSFASERKTPLLVAVETVCSDPARTFTYDASSSEPPPTTTTAAPQPPTTAAPATTTAAASSPTTVRVPAATQPKVAPAPTVMSAPSTPSVPEPVAASAESTTSTTATSLAAEDPDDPRESASSPNSVPTASSGAGSSSMAAYVLFAALLAGLIGWTVRLRRRKPTLSQ